MNAYVQRIGTRTRDIDVSIADAAHEWLEVDLHGTSEVSGLRRMSNHEHFAIFSAAEEDIMLAKETEKGKVKASSVSSIPLPFVCI